MLPPPLLNALFSTAVYEDAVIARGLRENAAFRDIADYATRGHALALQMVREDYPKYMQKELPHGVDYGVAWYAADAYIFIGTFAAARVNGADYERALYEALESSDAAMKPHLYLNDGNIEDSVRLCGECIRGRNHGSGKAGITRDALFEVSFAVKFLSMHLNQHNRIPDGSLLGLKKIQEDINDALKAGTGLENAAQTENSAPEFLFMTKAQKWLQQQSVQSMVIEQSFRAKIKQGFALDEKIHTMLETGGLYRHICVCLHSILAEDVQSGDYLAEFDAVAGHIARDAPLDPAIVLHSYVQQVLAGNLYALQSGKDASYRGPEDAPLYAAAYSALVQGIQKEFPLRTGPSLQRVPQGPAFT